MPKPVATELESAGTENLVGELRKRMAQAFLRRLQAVVTPRDALVFTAAAVLGIAVDSNFFPGGLTAPLVSLLSGFGAAACWKLWTHTGWQRRSTLRMIKSLRDEGLISDDEATKWRRIIVEEYISLSSPEGRKSVTKRGRAARSPGES